MSKQGPNDPSQAFEREKWEAEQRRLEREFSLKDRELTSKEKEAQLARWWNPLAIAILGAAIAALGGAYVSYQNNKANLDLETYRAESARIFEIVKTGDPNKAADNLHFLLDTGLIQNSKTAMSIRNYLKERKKGEGVALPVPDALARQIAPRANLRGSDLSRRNLLGADLLEADLSDANLLEANLDRANLRFANLRAANLNKANLNGALLRDALLRDANLDHANLRFADLSEADLSGALLRGTDLSGADLSDAKLDGQAQLDEACGTDTTKLPPGLILKPCPSSVGPPLNPKTTP